MSNYCWLVSGGMLQSVLSWAFSRSAIACLSFGMQAGENGIDLGLGRLLFRVQQMVWI